MKFDFVFFLESFPRIAAAALTNVQLSLAIFALATLGGTALTVARALKRPVLNMAIAALISFVRGTPLMIQIFLFFYALPALGVRLSPIQAGVLAIALNSAVFVTEIMRGGLSAMDPGPIEAATALGLRPSQIWRLVVLPQLFRSILPMLASEGTIIVKGTALLSIITVVEALRTAQQLGAAEFRPFEPMVGAALVFLAINLAVAGAARLAERRYGTEAG